MEMKKVRFHETGFKSGIDAGRRKRGAVLIETAACIIFLLALTLGIIQFGVFYNKTNSLTQVAREGGRFAAVYGITTTDNPATPGDESQDQYIVDRMKVVANAASIQLADSDVTITPARAARTRYGQVTVSVKYDLNKVAFLTYRPGEATRASVMMIE